MEIVKLTIEKRASYETNVEQEPYRANIILKDSGNDYKPDITLHLTQELIDPIIRIAAAAATDAFTDAARQFQENVLRSLKGPPVEAKAVEAPPQD